MTVYRLFFKSRYKNKILRYEINYLLRFVFRSCTHTKCKNEWWQLDFDQEFIVNHVILWNRLDCCQNRIAGVQVCTLYSMYVIQMSRYERYIDNDMGGVVTYWISFFRH